MNAAVIGMLYGDEGKGIVTDYLCSQDHYKYVCRFSGGPQSGHTVYYDKDRYHIFSTFGSGSFRNCTTILDKNFMVDPISLSFESRLLNDSSIIISELCEVITPYDVYNNSIDKTNLNNGSCGKGLYQTKHRNDNHYSLTVYDLMFPNIVKEKLKNISNYYNIKLEEDIFYRAVDYLLGHCLIYDEKEILSLNNIVFEGSQGLLLDQNVGFFPNVTPSNTGLKNIQRPIEEVYLVSRCYQTRHGNGFLSYENEKNINQYIGKYETNISNKFQKDFRISVLDLDMWIYALHKHNIDITKCNLVITHMDELFSIFKNNHYFFMYKNSEISYHNEKDFISNIIDIIGKPKSILLSYSPYSENIIKYEI